MAFPSFLQCLLAAAFFSCRPVKAEDKFDICKQRVERIRRGDEAFSTTYKGVALIIDNTTIEQYVYKGHVTGMNDEFERTSRERFLTLYTEGCNIICENPTDWYWASDFSLTLGIVSNWILPIIALLAALPYDSDASTTSERDEPATRGEQGRLDGARAGWLARKSVWRTIWALLNWLGSPQLAMTATLFNIYQIWRCSRAATAEESAIPGRPCSEETPQDRLRIKKDAYYVLCCIGQFEFPMGLPPARAGTPRNPDGFLEIMVYGLLRPICDDPAPAIPHILTPMEDRNRKADERAKEMTASLLQSIAFQMRTLRRQGVFASFASIFLFYVAFAVSVVMAFADIGERTTAHSLAFGMLISWFPLLLLFAILDRNPTSAGRTRDLISRWMWNVRAVKQWSDGGPFKDPPRWWSQDSKDVALEVSDFVGQGRQVGYNGIAFAVLDSIAAETTAANAPQTANAERERLTLDHLDSIAVKTVDRVQNRRPPKAWWLSALISFSLVWIEIGAALMISMRIPTVGVGCRSLSYFVYGFFSTVPMLMQLALNWRWGTSERLMLRVWVRRLSDMFCLLAVLTLVFITFAAFSGVLKNCTCRGGFTGGYIDFENAAFYRDTRHFNVAQWWWAATALVGVTALVSLGFAIGLLITLRPLWKGPQGLGKPTQTNGPQPPHTVAGNVQGSQGITPAMLPPLVLNTTGSDIPLANLPNGHSPGQQDIPVHRTDMCWLD